MRTIKVLTLFAVVFLGAGCGEGKTNTPKVSGDQKVDLKPLPTPGSPGGGGEAPKAKGTPGGTPNSQ